jgi:pilus assembly protein CpaE
LEFAQTSPFSSVEPKEIPVASTSFIVFSQQEEMATHLHRALQRSGHATVVATVFADEELPAAVHQHKPDAILVDLGHAPHAVLDILERIAAPRPQIVACGPQDQSDVILRALKQGAREFLSAAPGADEIRTAVDRIVIEQAALPKASQAAPVLAVMGAKGGVGATVVACQLAASLQRLGGRTALVDLNIPLGDVALYFDVQPSYTIADAALDEGELDRNLVNGLLQPHQSGLQILAAPPKMEDVELITERHVHSVIDTLRADFDWVVIDVSRSWSEYTMRALDMSTDILLVALQDVPSLTHARAHRELLLRLGYASGKLHIIVNRASKRDRVSTEDLAQFLDAEPDMCLPNDYAASVTCVNEGRPISNVAAKSALDMAFRELAQMAYTWSGIQLPDGKKARRGLRKRASRLFKKEK